MKKMQISDFGAGKVIHNGVRSLVLQLSNGDILKLYNYEYLENAKICGVDIEKKILDSENRNLEPGIMKPKIAVYDSNYFLGDVTSPAKGINYGDWESGLNQAQRSDLNLYATIYNRLEEILKSTPDIVYPDICSYDNIFVSENGKRVELIDYEGFQVGDYPSISFSTGLGAREILIDSQKYCKGFAPNSLAPLYTKELDIKSLIFFYFRTTFNIDLRLVEQYGIDLDTIFRAINLDNPDLMHKVWKIFQEKEKNEWLGKDVFKIADEYKIEVCNNGAKTLVRK